MRVTARRSRRSWARSARARWCSARAARSAAWADGPPRPSSESSARASAALKRCGWSALTTIASSSMPSSVRSARSKSTVSLTGISSGSAVTSTPVEARSRRNSSMRSAWRAIGPDLRDPGEGARRAQHREPVAGGRGVDDREVEHGAARAPLELGELPDLADRDELGQARRGGGQVLEDPAPAQQAGERRASAAGSRATPPSRAPGRPRRRTARAPARARCGRCRSPRTSRRGAPARPPRTRSCACPPARPRARARRRRSSCRRRPCRSRTPAACPVATATGRQDVKDSVQSVRIRLS